MLRLMHTSRTRLLPLIFPCEYHAHQDYMLLASTSTQGYISSLELYCTLRATSYVQVMSYKLRQDELLERRSVLRVF